MKMKIKGKTVKVKLELIDDSICLNVGNFHVALLLPNGKLSRCRYISADNNERLQVNRHGQIKIHKEE